MEGAARMIKAYDTSRCWLWLMRCLCDCCVDKSEYRHKLFKGRYLRAEQAVEPTLILWENLGVTKKQRCFRIFLSSLFAIMLLLATTFLILYVKIQENELKQDQVRCTLAEEITREQALSDHQLPKEQ
mmetsp:Transcript_20514/g.25230  ORF Transcript_20514/g.25230 Transcript_20514/m.25230 type:complete len:128 (+) Transcript_20514:1742-2125(+)